MRVLLLGLAVWLLGTDGVSAQTLSPRTLNVSRLLNKGLPTVTPSDQYRLFLGKAAAAIDNAPAREEGKAKAILAAQQALQNAATVGVPNTDWYLLSAAVQALAGNSVGYAKTVTEGHAAYPYSSRLGFEHGKLLLNDQRASAQAFASLTLSPAAQTQLRSWMAFRQNNWVRGLIEAERAYYLDREAVLPLELRQRVMSLYTELASAGEPSLPAIDTADAFAVTYAQALISAGELLRKQPSDSVSTTDLDAVPSTLPKLRVVALRNFADRGLLGTYNDPLLVDLYVLDKAGHLEAATQTFLQAVTLAGQRQVATSLTPEQRAAEAYMQRQWAADVEAALPAR